MHFLIFLKNVYRGQKYYFSFIKSTLFKVATKKDLKLISFEINLFFDDKIMITTLNDIIENSDAHMFKVQFVKNLSKTTIENNIKSIRTFTV